MTTIQDVAGDLGLSAMTVSRALNGHPDVKEETRRRVISRAQELNYRPNRWARSLVTQRSHIIGVVIPRINFAFFSEVVGAVQETVEQQGYSLILCNSSEDPDRERREIDMLVGSRAEGLIVASVWPYRDPSLFRGLQEEGVPFVLIDRIFEGFSAHSVVADDVMVGRLAAEHLIELGHRRIAHIKVESVSSGVGRLKGFLEGAKAAGVEVRDEYVVEGGFDVQGGMRGMRRLLALNPRPTAVFGPSDPAAMGAIRVCRDEGLRVPADMSIVGAGAIEYDYLPEPFLTTLRWDRRAMGIEAGQMLLSQINGEGSPKQAIFRRPSLVVHRSTAML